MDAAGIRRVSWGRQIVGLLLTIPCGLVGFAMVFGDVRWLLTGGWYLGAGAVVGAIAGSRRWWLSIACAWTSVAVMAFVGTRTLGSVVQLVAIPIALSGLGGFVGARVWERRARTASGSPRGPVSPGA